MDFPAQPVQMHRQHAKQKETNQQLCMNAPDPQKACILNALRIRLYAI